MNLNFAAILGPKVDKIHSKGLYVVVTDISHATHTLWKKTEKYVLDGGSKEEVAAAMAEDYRKNFDVYWPDSAPSGKLRPDARQRNLESTILGVFSKHEMSVAVAYTSNVFTYFRDDQAGQVREVVNLIAPKKGLYICSNWNRDATGAKVLQQEVVFTGKSDSTGSKCLIVSAAIIMAVIGVGFALMRADY